MTALSELLFAFIDLIKAELRESRAGVVKLAVALGVVWVGMFLMIAALGLVLGALYVALASVLPTSSAILLTALAAALLGGLLIWIGVRSTSTR